MIVQFDISFGNAWGIDPPTKILLWLLKVTRSLSSDERLVELIEEVRFITLDVIGPSDVRRQEEVLTQVSNGHMFNHRGHDDSTYGGVGFLIHSMLYSVVQNVITVSTRVWYVNLSKRYSSKTVQIYASISDHGDNETEAFYDDIDSGIGRLQR